MSQSVYKPKYCAFHPKEVIFNFCKNLDCLLPLCPTCVDLHTEEHKQEKTFGKFENIHQVVNEISFNLESRVKELVSLSDDIQEQISCKKINEISLRREIKEAKERVIGLVERFFDGFEKEVGKSITEFNVSIEEDYRNMENRIKCLKTELNSRNDNLATEKVLKTVIAYHSKAEEEKTKQNIHILRENLETCGNKKMLINVDNKSIQKVINELSNYLLLSFNNWQPQIKYNTSNFVKTDFSHQTTSHSPAKSLNSNDSLENL